ncbi:phosphopantetheine-binding protein, partial [Pseudomonas sp. NPDC089752]|uniref:AMP-binding enzyme n=1 Tax=Pseudomonas sp. NPDC089752 TaxID=3364472 RepID=UPI00382C9A0E
IEYMGRIDHQVKIRGLRIELGEIEARLLEQDEVREAAVLAVDSPSGLQLAAYVVAAAPPEAAVVLRERLRAALAEHLPDYMVPNHLLFLDALPLSPNGKLERKALPGLGEQCLARAWRAPQTELEGQLAEVWEQVLQVERVGLDDNFFALGGHSLLATQVVVRVRSLVRVEVPLKDLFETDSLEAFAERVQGLCAVHRSVDDELAKSLEALKRLSSTELEKLLS